MSEVEPESKGDQIIALLRSINKKIQKLIEALQPPEEHKKPIKKLPKSTKKMEPDAAGKVYNFMGKVAPYTCNKCGGLISWDLRPERIPPLHVDKNGHMIGNGDCPEYNTEGD